MMLEVRLSKKILGARRIWTNKRTRICMRSEMLIESSTTIEGLQAVRIRTWLIFESRRALVRLREGDRTQGRGCT